MNTRTISIIYLIILIICFIAMTVCISKAEYSIETGTYQTEIHRFENLKEFKDCVKKCILNEGADYTSGCLDDLDCSKCLDECSTKYNNPDTVLVDRIFTDIDNETCFIETL